MIDIGEWAEIRRLHMTEGLSVREISNRLGIAWKTVDRALANEHPAKYPTRSRPSIVDPYVQDMTRILTQFPRMGAPTLAQRVGYTGGLRRRGFETPGGISRRMGLPQDCLT
ncbi:hypothetical protein ACQCSU_14620 [Pseudarthrobacter sp. O4]|uniref:hypothetical protein n=1 Tax=Pseudarthrobacter sp. O4 TaxID=3418417 RepID=UPI003CEA4F7C